jgi:putative aldouronate transport system substrate-binding protein
MKDKNPNFKLMGVPYPGLKKGEVPNFGQKDFPIDSNAGAAITTANKFQKESMMYLDYGFTEEGHMLFNFGIEGESYTMVNGYPKYTDFVTKNPKGLTFGQAATQYSRAIYNGPFVCDPRYFEQYMQYPEQLQAVNEWRKAGDKARYPPATPTPDESQKLATLMNEINTYVDEMTLKFIMGQESLDKFDEYLSKVKGMGIDEAVKIKQTALERFNKR